MLNLNNIDSLKLYKHIHLIGIGGVSMSGIAEILKNWGCFVTGSDISKSKTTDRLASHGIYISIGHSTQLIEKANLVIYSAAIKQDDPELIVAKQNNIPVIERSDFVGFITRIFNNSIGIAGTHGKTTTTSMVSLCFIEAGLDPTIQVGAFLKEINGNYRIGNSEYFILEACEYVESFLKFSPRSSIVLNIDNDHLDYFKNFENINKAFEKYVKILPRDGFLIINADDENCFALRKLSLAKAITFGLESKNATFSARNISFDINGFPKFDVYHHNTYYGEFKLSVPGKHNIYNALACIALCANYGIDKYVIKSALLKFTGANRRFEYIGDNLGFSVYDDYAHHPIEIKATFNAMKSKQHRQSWVIFQPHTYSRTKLLLDDFANALIGFDNIIITDIYAAREINSYNISSEDLVNKINLLGKKAIYIQSFSDIAEYINTHACPHDIVLTLGAGSITELSKKLVKKETF